MESDEPEEWRVIRRMNSDARAARTVAIFLFLILLLVAALHFGWIENDRCVYADGDEGCQVRESDLRDP